jgi:ATP phosphoribosyltransferase
MPTFAVRFKGILFGPHHEQLRRAGISLRSSEPSIRLGGIETGEPIHTVAVEAGSEQEALEAVEAALGIDTVNFSAWEAGPA